MRGKKVSVSHSLEGGLVYNGGHVCETLLLLAAIKATAQCQISGGITNGVNYNIFWCMGKFRHWPGVMTIPQKVLRKSVRMMCWCPMRVSALCNKKKERGTHRGAMVYFLSTDSHPSKNRLYSWASSFLFVNTSAGVAVICLHQASCEKQNAARVWSEDSENIRQDKEICAVILTPLWIFFHILSCYKHNRQSIL